MTTDEEIQNLHQRLNDLKGIKAAERLAIREEIYRKKLEQENQFKDKLAHTFGLPRGPLFEKAYQLAYERGHDSGEQFVEVCFEELADLLAMARVSSNWEASK
jgi:hypothetical protein